MFKKFYRENRIVILAVLSLFGLLIAFEIFFTNLVYTSFKNLFIKSGDAVLDICSRHVTGFINDIYSDVILLSRYSILLKKGKLTSEEFEEIKKHVYIGTEIINEIIRQTKVRFLFFELGRNIIKYHHEKYDGSGYPFNLKGEEIPLEARIFSVVDAYDAIRSKRPYKDEVSHDEAVGRILADKGKHFDPDIVDAFIRCNVLFSMAEHCSQDLK